jgi:outer membrane immunogenic protein
MVRLRTLLVGAGMLAMSSALAQAADMAVLRGSYTYDLGYARWDGFSVGGTVGFSNLSTNFGNAPGSDIAYILRNTTLEDEFQPSGWTTLPKTVTNSAQYGFFLGYNWQMDQLVLGLDAGYNHMSSTATSASDTIERIVTTSDKIQHDVTISAQSSLKLIDYATLRGRAGYAFGQFLPYAMVGLAVGRFNYSNAVLLADAQTDTSTTPNTFLGTFVDSASDGQDNVIVGGVVAGLGVDYAVLPNVFLRAEWEYIYWGPVGGIKSALNTGRVGLGFRF